MSEPLHIVTLQPRRRFLRWAGVAVLSAASLLGMVWVPAQSFLTAPSMVSPLAALSAEPTDPFASLRLASYSGLGFSLFPDLAKLFPPTGAAGPRTLDPSACSEAARQLTTFVNPEYVTFTEYQIRNRDNYWKVAKGNGYTIDTIVGCNPHLERIVCYTGQRILLPSRGGCLHHLSEGETLPMLSLLYRVPEAEIRAANRWDPDWGLLPGMTLFIPGAKPLHLSGGMHEQYARRALFRSPLSGRYTSGVGRRIHPVLGFSKFHNGVDIACRMRSWVGAAAGGTVVDTGSGGAIGKYIKIDHHNGFMTLYGHLDAIYVRRGQTVKAGQLIARSGNTGRSTGPHLHFTIWNQGRVVNPMDYLW